MKTFYYYKKLKNKKERKNITKNLPDFIFTCHAYKRWGERFSDKNFKVTINGMEKLKQDKNRSYYCNNGVTLVCSKNIVLTVY